MTQLTTFYVILFETLINLFDPYSNLSDENFCYYIHFY